MSLTIDIVHKLFQLKKIKNKKTIITLNSLISSIMFLHNKNDAIMAIQGLNLIVLLV